MKTYFADTFYYLALLNKRDEHHLRVREYTSALSARIMTTDWILTEVGDAFAVSHHRREFARVVRRLRSHPENEVVPCSRDYSTAGWPTTKSAQTRHGR